MNASTSTEVRAHGAVAVEFHAGLLIGITDGCGSRLHCFSRLRHYGSSDKLANREFTVCRFPVILPQRLCLCVMLL